MEGAAIQAPTEGITPEVAAQAYCYRKIPRWRRFATALLVLCLGSVVGAVWLIILHHDRNLFPYAALPIGVLAFTGLGAWRVWRLQERHEYTTERRPRNMRPRKIRAAYVSVLVAIGMGFVWHIQNENGQLAEYWWYVWPVALIWLLVVPEQLLVRTEKVPTAAAERVIADERQKAKALADQQAQERLNAPPGKIEIYLLKLWSNWLVRYAVGAILFFAAYEVFSIEPSPKLGWLLVTGLVIGGMLAMKEAAVWGIVVAIFLAIASAVLGAASALPVSAAIIIGAMIIAGAVSR